MVIKYLIVVMLLSIISGCYNNSKTTGENLNTVKMNISLDEVCDEEGHSFVTATDARASGLSDSEFGATYCNNKKSLHYTWDMNEDGINDCENDGSCDHTVDYSVPRYEIPGIKGGIVFDKRSGKWVDKYGICHTCTPENSYKNDGTMDQSMFEERDLQKNTIATITESVELPDGVFAYTITYNVTEGDAINKEGKLIRGLLSQHVFGAKGLAIVGQKIKIRYRKDGPIFHELLERIKFKSPLSMSIEN